jgi:putative addiction module component (TIGR02574 family)
MPVFEDILDAARTLTPTDRMRLIDALWEDVAPSEWPLPSAEWIAEAQWRSDEHDQGSTSPAPWTDVRDRARKKAGREE